jgi:hypothetical protein
MREILGMQQHLVMPASLPVIRVCFLQKHEFDLKMPDLESAPASSRQIFCAFEDASFGLRSTRITIACVYTLLLGSAHHDCSDP